jgi:hypothetical protein
MSVCLFLPKTRVAFKSDTKIRGYIYDWFDGDRDAPKSQNMYAVSWDGISGQYWYYANELVDEKTLKASYPEGKSAGGKAEGQESDIHNMDNMETLQDIEARRWLGQSIDSSMC